MRSTWRRTSPRQSGKPRGELGDPSASADALGSPSSPRGLPDCLGLVRRQVLLMIRASAGLVLLAFSTAAFAQTADEVKELQAKFKAERAAAVEQKLAP